MEGISTVADVDAFCARLYAGDKTATHLFTAIGWAGCLKEMGLPLVMRVVMESQSSQSIIFACRVFGECMDAVFKTEGPAGLTEVARLVFGRLRGASGMAPTHAAAHGAMERLIALVVRCGYRHSPDVASLPSVFLKEGHTLLQAEMTHAGAAGAPLRAVCAVLDAVVVALGEPEATSMTAEATGAASTASRFRDEYLLDVYRLASGVIKRVGHSPALDSALRLLTSVMDYDITCSPHDTEDEASRWVCTAFPLSWQSTVVDSALFQRLWVLYQLSGPNPSTLQLILELLRSYVGVKSGQFANVVERGKWIEVTLLQTQVIMGSSLHLELDDVRAVFAVLLNRIKPACSLDELTAAPSFQRWLASCLSFTQTCLAQCRLPDSCVLSLLSVWSALGGALSYATAPVDGLADALTLVVSAYLSAVSRHVKTFVDEMAQGTAGAESLDYILEDDAEGARLQLQFVVAVAASSGREGTSALQQFAQAAYEQAPAAILETADAVTAVAAAERASWLLRLAAVSLSEAALSSDPDTTEVVAFFAILFLYRWTRESRALRHLPELVRGHVEQAATRLSETVGKVLLMPAYASSRKVAKGVVQRLVAAQVLESDDGFTTLWFSLVLERCWISLWAPNTSVATRVANLQYVCQLASGSSALRAMKGTRPFHRFVDLAPEHAPPCGTERQWHRIRFLYARCVGQLRLSESVLIGHPSVAASVGSENPARPDWTAVSLRRLVQPILAVWESVPAASSSSSSSAAVAGAEPAAAPALSTAGPDEAALIASLCDARGLLFSATRRAFVGLVELFHGYIPRLAACLLTPSHFQKPTAVQLLKLVAEMTLNRSQRAFFGDHSALGMHLARHAQRVVEAASTMLATVTQGSPAEGDSTWLWKVLRATLDIGRNVLRGGYCNWAVFAQFDEGAFTSFLNVLWPLASNVGLVDGVQHPKVLLSLLNLINELLIPFFAPFWESRPPAQAQYVIGLVEAVAFPSLSVQDASKTYAIGVLQRLVELCAEPRTRTLATEDEAAQCARLRHLFISLDPQRLHRIITCSIESTLPASRSLTTAQGNLLRATLLAEGDQLGLVANYFSARCPTPQAAEACLQICREIAERAVAMDVEGVKSTSGQLVDHLRTCL